MSTITLDSIREAAEKKYGSFQVQLGSGEVVELRNVLRLTKAEREAFKAAQDREGGDEQEMFEGVLRILAKPGQGDTIVNAIGGDLAVLAQVFASYTEATELGEASRSES